MGKVEKALHALAESVAALAEAQRRHYEEFAAHRQEFLAYRAEAEQRFAELREEVAAARAEADRRFAELAEAQRRHYEEFAAYRAETDRRFAELAEAQRRTEETLQRMNRRLEHHATDLGMLKGIMEAQRLRDQAPLFFSDLLRHPQPVAPERLAERLQEALGAGRITRTEKQEAQVIDLVIEGLHPWEERRLYLAVEVSWQGGTEDVQRAYRRAAILSRALEAETWPVVGAREMTPAARRMARSLGVWWVQDGQAFRPEEIPEGEEPEETSAPG